MYAVFIEEDGSYIPVSYGDTDFECLMWLQDHPYFSTHYKTFIGVVLVEQQKIKTSV